MRMIDMGGGRFARLACGLTAAVTAIALAETSAAKAALPSQESSSPQEVAESQRQGADHFEAKIRPLLIDNCGKCHGEKRQRAGLRVDLYSGLLKGGERGLAVVPGNLADSLLIQAVGYEDTDLQMPPRAKLADEDILLLREWVAAGAPGPLMESGTEESEEESSEHTAGASEPGMPWQERLQHWSLQSIATGAALAVPQPLGSGVQAGFAEHEIDRFIWAQLDQHNLKPAALADRATLLRRLSFDTIGLPPTPEVLATFLAEGGDVFAAGGAWEALVDEHLDSPHYGERWARHWLDLVRYAESRGHEFDYDLPNTYQYRDYLIRAFNEDLPYDRLMTEHVAGDLVDPPRRDSNGANESVLGTGFWFLGEEVHSPVDIRADQVDRLANQVDVFSKTFMGLTAACARCHDHKFDAIRQTDYYALSGFPLSMRYRQARFDTELANAEVAKELEALDKRYHARLQPKLVQGLAEQLDRLPTWLGVAIKANQEKANGVSDETRASSSLSFGALPTELAWLYEGFESGYGAWTSEGTAFGASPVTSTQLGDWQEVSGWRGEHFINSHNARNGELSYEESDRHLGSLTSPVFVVERDYIHFLLGGGTQTEELADTANTGDLNTAEDGRDAVHKIRTGLELLVDGEVVRSQTAQENSNRLQPQQFDVHDLLGQRAQLRLVDRAEGSWGQVLADQIVFSNSPDSTALDTEETRADVSSRAITCEQLSSLTGDSFDVLWAWTQRLNQAEKDERDPWHRIAVKWIALQPEAVSFSAVGQPTQRKGIALDLQNGWIQDGFGFGSGLLSAGQLRLLLPGENAEGVGGLEPNWRLSLCDESGAYWDATWNCLTLAEGTQRDPSRIDWTQAGRTWHSASQVLEKPSLWLKVRGAGQILANVDSHRMNQGPLHGALIQKVASQPQFKSAGHRELSTEIPVPAWHWVRMNLEDYVGHSFHLEASPASSQDGRFFALADARLTDGEAPEDLRAQDQRWFISPETLEECSPESFAEQLLASLQTLNPSAEREDPVPSTGQSKQPEDLRLLAAWIGQPELWDPAALELFLGEDFSEYNTERRRLTDSIQRVSRLAPVALDGSGQDEYLLARGSSKSPMQPVARNFLSAFSGAWPADASDGKARGSQRSALAEALCSDANPLPARVQVNRLWKHLMGRGLVSSVDDFGHMGRSPSHPQLLDWLATEFRKGDWSQKALLKRIMLSRTYRLSSVADANSLEADPLSVWCHYRPVRRLDGEALRDALLSISGQLDTELFGAPTPIHLSSFLQGRGRPPQGPLDGHGRRSLYLAVRRNFLSPFFGVFDRPAPATTVGNRNVSNVPAQALMLLNDPFVAEMAKLWSAHERELVPGETDQQLIKRLFTRALSREPELHELQALQAFLDSARLDATAGEAEGEADDFGWSELCHALINLKEFSYLY